MEMNSMKNARDYSSEMIFQKELATLTSSSVASAADHDAKVRYKSMLF